MRYLASLLGLLLATLPAYAHKHTQELAQLTQEMSRLYFLPFSMQTATPSRLKITYLPDGAFARWNPKTDTFEVSKTHWKQTPDVRCLLPLFVHESFHALLVKQARTTGFAWPVTLQDEIPAFYYQLATEQTMPDYAVACATWRAELTEERRALASHNWTQFETAIYTRYSQFGAKELPPPPFTESWISDAQQDIRAISFYKHIYPLRHRNLTAEKFWRKGGSWLRLSPKELTRAQQDPRYPIYKNMLQQFFSK